MDADTEPEDNEENDEESDEEDEDDAKMAVDEDDENATPKKAFWLFFTHTYRRTGSQQNIPRQQRRGMQA
jgi:hypothetical protein